MYVHVRACACACVCDICVYMCKRNVYIMYHIHRFWHTISIYASRDDICICICVCVCVRARARVCVCVRVRVCVIHVCVSI